MGKVGLFSLEKEQLWAHVTAALSAYRAYQEDREGLFMMEHGGRIKAHIN